MLLVVKCTKFLLGAGILHGYSLIAGWLLVSTLLLMRYPIKEDTDLESNSGILPERRYFFLHL